MSSPGTPDGSRPGRWRINAGVHPPQLMPPLEGTAFHETIPGHHLQGAIAHSASLPIAVTLRQEAVG